MNHELLDHRFEVQDLLGQGAQARTYRGLDRQTGHPVAIKELLLHHVDSWKAVELFEREGQMLQRLDHPAIPDYVATLHVEGDDGRERFFLVQELVDGEDLKILLDRGHRFDEAAARDFLARLLEVLVYLQDLSPVVIHRDIKPSNILRRADGGFALIDFGAVQAVMPAEGGGSTVVGTTGYMPVEQLMGRADTSTDLYALAATTVHMLSGRHPNDLPMEDLRLRFEDAVNISPALQGFLTRMLTPQANRRFRTAREALAALQSVDEPAPPAPAPQPSLRPRDLIIMMALMLFIFGAPLLLLVFQDSSGSHYEGIQGPHPQVEVDLGGPNLEEMRRLHSSAAPEPDLEPEPEPERHYPEFAETPPTHIGPFTLGMTIEEAHAAVPDEGAWRRRARGRPMPPGESWVVQTSLLSYPAECLTYFCDDEGGGLCNISCHVHREFPVEEYRHLGNDLVALYRDVYGSETRYFFNNGTSERIYWWTHPNAELILRNQAQAMDTITGTHGHSNKRLSLNSAFYLAWERD